jgi:hypothetical protein
MIAKDNQPALRADIATVFEAKACAPSFGPAPTELRSTTDKAHGRLERRT